MPRREHDEHECGDDRSGAGVGREIGRMREPGHLRRDHGGDADEQQEPARGTASGTVAASTITANAADVPGHPRVDRLQPGRERRADEADRRHGLRRPGYRDHDGDRRDEPASGRASASGTRS